MKELERKKVDSPTCELSDGLKEPAVRHVYRICHLSQQLQQEENHQKESDSSTELIDKQVEGINQSYVYQNLHQTHHTHPSAQDDEPPVLTYEGGPRSEPCYQSQLSSSCKDTSSSDGDQHSSDKEASTDEEEFPVSSCSVMGSYNNQHPPGVYQPASPPPSAQASSRTQSRDPQGELKGTALPHKLRLKHRAMSTGSSCSGQESPTTPPSATPPPLPQDPCLSNGNCKFTSSGEGAKKESMKKEASRRRNKKRD